MPAPQNQRRLSRYLTAMLDQEKKKRGRAARRRVHIEDAERIEPLRSDVEHALVRVALVGRSRAPSAGSLPATSSRFSLAVAHPVRGKRFSQ
jgi:hypothetical protein